MPEEKQGSSARPRKRKKLGRYEVVGEVGRGGMGIVFKAHEPDLDRWVAIKVLPRRAAENSALLARFRREAKAMAQLKHPNVVRIFTIDQDRGFHYFAMEFVAGPTLAKRLEAGAMPVDEALEIFAQVADAVASAHEAGLVHRDIKPGNVLLEPDGKTAKVSDFGLASIMGEATRITTAGTTLGTPRYMSPEQGTGGPIDARTDVYSLGVLLYEMLTGQVPFIADSAAAIVHKIIYDEAPDVTSLRPDAPEYIARVIATALAKKPEDRFQSVRDMMDKLGIETGTTIIEKPQAQAKQSRWPRWARISATVAAALVAFLIVAALGSKNRRDGSDLSVTPKAGVTRTAETDTLPPDDTTGTSEPAEPVAHRDVPDPFVPKPGAAYDMHSGWPQEILCARDGSVLVYVRPARVTVDDGFDAQYTEVTIPGFYVDKEVFTRKVFDRFVKKTGYVPGTGVVGIIKANRELPKAFGGYKPYLDGAGLSIGDALAYMWATRKRLPDRSEVRRYMMNFHEDKPSLRFCAWFLPEGERAERLRQLYSGPQRGGNRRIRPFRTQPSSPKAGGRDPGSGRSSPPPGTRP